MKPAPWFYIKAPSGRRSLESAFVHPYIMNEQTQNYLSFKHLLRASLPLPQMDRLLQSVINGALEDTPVEVEGFMRAESRRASAPAPMPYKRVYLLRGEYGEEDPAGGWPDAEDIINGALALTTLQGAIAPLVANDPGVRSRLEDLMRGGPPAR